MGNNLVLGTLNQTLETIRTTSASVQSIVWEPTVPTVTGVSPGRDIQSSSVQITPMMLNTLLASIPPNRSLTLGRVYFGNLTQALANDCGPNTFANLGWVIRVGAFPAELNRQGAIDFIIGNEQGVYTSPPAPVSSGSSYSIGVYAKVINIPINTQQQARQALVGGGNIITVGEELYFIDNSYNVSTVPSTMTLYPQSTITIPNTEGVFWKEISETTQNLSYVWLATPENATSIENWKSNPDDFPNKVECIPCATGTTCDTKTGICTKGGSSSDTPWYKTWWFITIISLVAALIVILLIVGIIRAGKKRSLLKAAAASATPVVVQSPEAPVVVQAEKAPVVEPVGVRLI